MTASRDPLREVLDDALTELRQRRAQVAGFVTYVVLAAGGLYLFSAVGADSRTHSDTVRRTTLLQVSVGLLALGVLLGAATLAVDRRVRRRVRPGALPRHLHSRRALLGAMVAGSVLTVLGVLALGRWS